MMKQRIALVIIISLLLVAAGGPLTSVKAGSLNDGLQQWQDYLKGWEEKLEAKAKGLQQWEDYLVKLESSLKNTKSSDNQNDLSVEQEKLEEKKRGLQQWENHLKSWEQELDKRENSDQRFIVSNVSYQEYQYVDGTKVYGEIKNNFGQDLQIANFTVTFYDQEGNILDVGSLGLSDWKSGSKKTFKVIVDEQLEGKVARYKVQYDGGY